MRIIRIDICTKGGTLRVWPEKLLMEEPTHKLFPTNDKALARKIALSTVDIDANRIRATYLYGKEEDYYVYEGSGIRVVAAEEIKESEAEMKDS